MLKTVFSLGFLLLALTSMPPARAQDMLIRNQTYICERGVALQVVFLTDKERSYAVLSVDGKLVAMREDNHAQDRLFVAFDEQDSYRLHIKGNDASLSYKDNDQAKNENVILQSCQADIGED